jgi:hypothetical protein
VSILGFPRCIQAQKQKVKSEEQRQGFRRSLDSSIFVWWVKAFRILDAAVRAIDSKIGPMCTIPGRLISDLRRLWILEFGFFKERSCADFPLFQPKIKISRECNDAVHCLVGYFSSLPVSMAGLFAHGCRIVQQWMLIF